MSGLYSQLRGRAAQAQRWASYPSCEDKTLGYYMRYIVSDDQDVSLTLLESALKQIDSSYQIERDDEPDDEGALMHDNKLYGQIEVNRPGDGLFEGEIEELKGFVGSADSEPKTRVLNVLNQATALVVIRVLDQGRESEATLVKIDHCGSGFLQIERA